MTNLETLTHLNRLYLTAVKSACGSPRTRAETYRELASELHEAMESITHGVEGAAVIEDLGELWTETSAQCDSREDEVLFGAWAGMLATVGTEPVA